jgi:hypothetical protein
MIRDIKFIVHSMVMKVKSIKGQAEALATARLLSKLKKVIIGNARDELLILVIERPIERNRREAKATITRRLGSPESFSIDFGQSDKGNARDVTCYLKCRICTT